MLHQFKYLYCGPPGINLFSLLFKKKNEFSIFSWFRNNNVIFVYKARTAIAYIPKLLGMRTDDQILVPAYNCGSEIDCLLKAGISIDFYQVNRECGIELSDIERRISIKTKAIYVTHYFGFTLQLSELKELCKERGLYLIEDCALSLLSSSNQCNIGTIGDVAVFSFPKTLSVPDGGALVINNPTLVVDNWPTRIAPITWVLPRVLSLIKASVLREWAHSRFIYFSYELLRTFATKQLHSVSKANNAKLNQSNNKPEMPNSYYYNNDLASRKISFLSRHVLSQCDYKSVIERRRANFILLLDLLSNNENITPLFRRLPSQICPLNFPVLVRNRDYLCSILNQQSIDALPWWAGYHKAFTWDGFEDARYLKDNLLALPIHQDLTEVDICFIAEKILDAV